MCRDRERGHEAGDMEKETGDPENGHRREDCSDSDFDWRREVPGVRVWAWVYADDVHTPTASRRYIMVIAGMRVRRLSIVNFTMSLPILLDIARYSILRGCARCDATGAYGPISILVGFSGAGY